MASENHPFYSLWAQGDIRECLLTHLAKSDICAVRLSNSACCNLVTRRLFQRVHITFTANSFTRPYRVEALARIGHHIDHITFYLPHSEATFLPPLIHPATGAEISYLYTPHTSMASTLTRPKYGNSELGDILTQQYPPLFHAATNVPSFIHAVKNVPNLRHLTIKTPGQDPAERYRRDIVDYALMSLRIAVERSPHLKKLTKLSLHGVHPAAFLYLKFQDGPGFGCSPIAGKRWRQIRKMHIAVDSWDFYGPGGPGLDQLKIIDGYLRQFEGTLEKLSFTWLGQKGPCPLALAEDPLFDTPRENKKLFNEVTSPMSPLPATPGVRPRIHFKKLKYLQVRNASMHSEQLRGLVESHRENVKEFDFENVILVNGGNWDEALQPLMRPPKTETHRDNWARYSVAGDGKSVHSEHTQHVENVAAQHSPSLPEEAFVTSPGMSRHSVADRDEAEVRHPSAAVEAVGKELLDMDVDGLEAFVGLSLSHSQTSSSDHTVRAESFDDDDSYTYYGDEQETIIVELDRDIDSAINLSSTNASEATLVPFSTKLKKRKRRRKPWHPKDSGTDDETAPPGLALAPTKSNRSRDELFGAVPAAASVKETKEKPERPSLRTMLSGHGHKRSNSSSQAQSQSQSQTHQVPNKLQKPPPATGAVYGPNTRSRQSSDPIPYMGGAHYENSTTYELPLVIASDDESPPNHNRTTQWPRPRAASNPPPPSYMAPPPPSYAAPPPPAQSTHSLSSQSVHSIPEEQEPVEGNGGVAPLNISAPIISTEALPVLLQPTVYSPQAYTTSHAYSNPQASTTSIPASVMTGGSSSRGSGGESIHSTHSAQSKISVVHHNNNGGGHNVNDGLSAVQRNLEQEEIQRKYAEDAEARTSALKKAREAVLERLGRLNGKDCKEEELLDMHPALQDEYGASASSRPRGASGGSGRLRELFGAVTAKNPGGAAGDKGHAEGMYMNVEESQSVLVPFVLSPTRG